MGDFNFPNINWDTLDSDLSSGRFRDLILDNYLVQHVKQPTRDTNILDLVFTSDFNMVDNVDVIEHLGNSDHNILTWKLICDVCKAPGVDDIVPRMLIENSEILSEPLLYVAYIKVHKIKKLYHVIGKKQMLH